MKRRSVVVFAVLIGIVIIVFSIIEGERLYSNSTQSQEAGASAQSQGAQNGGNAPTYH